MYLNLSEPQSTPSKYCFAFFLSNLWRFSATVYNDYGNGTLYDDYSSYEYSNETREEEEESKLLCGCPFTAQRRNFHIVFFVFSFIIPISVLIFCYASVYCEVVTVQRGLSEIGNESGGTEAHSIITVYCIRFVINTLTSIIEHHSRVARNTLSNISVLVFCYVFCWLPFHMYQLLQINGLNVSNDNCNLIEEIVKMSVSI